MDEYKERIIEGKPILFRNNRPVAISCGERPSRWRLKKDFAAWDETIRKFTKN